jgi:hypothetical protein
MFSKAALAATLTAALMIWTGTATAADLTPPKFTQAQIRKAAIRALASGARPHKLRAARPAWFTKKQGRKVKQDPQGWTPAPVDAPLPGEVGIRPGSWMISPYWCTTNFIFQKSGTLAIGTAGHCVDNSKPVLLTLAPSSGIPVLVELGKVLLKRNAGIGQDYALIEIPPQHWDWVFPTQAGVGGPCGVYTDNAPLPVAHYGHGVGVGTGGTPRAGMGFSLTSDPIGVKGTDWDWDADSIVWAGLINGGDSGSGVRVGTMPAVSNLTHGIGITGLEPSAIAWGTRVSTITNSGWTLVDSPLCP